MVIRINTVATVAQRWKASVKTMKNERKFSLVLAGITSCARKNDRKCERCPYANRDYCIEDLATDALIFLEKYKAIKAIIQDEGEK